MTWTDPVAAFEALARDHDRMFWLDGGGSREWSGRRSILGWLEDDDVSLAYDAARREVWRVAAGGRTLVGEDIFSVLAAEMERDGGDPEVSWVGWFGYACRADLPARVEPSGPGRVPDAVWMRSPRQLVFDHEADAGVRRTSAEAGRVDQGAPERALSRTTREEYASWFDQVQQQLRLGNTYEVNLTYRESVASGRDPVEVYLRLREVNPAPYAAYLQHEGVSVLSSSPERFATVDRRRWVETKPIKGTTPRGGTPEEDEANREWLRTDPRYRAENLMIVDLLRNDLSMVCEPGTVTVPVLMDVESYPSVHQLVSTVRGHLRDGIGTVEALRALFPAGSMTGAPKLRTMQVIADVETSPRGVYSGALGWVGGDGRADLGVVIRTLVGHDGVYTYGTGGGITVRSDAESEYDETRWKAARLLSALE
ncbi:MAG TPA: aminodeoxychorismate synthase component I [Nocardioidaceae bacterium]|nr:aminodeoxychorismate synthase component I [Nocardioidaceae bacterium]